MNHERLILEASQVWCPDVGRNFPRRVSNSNTFQTSTESRYKLVTNLMDAAEGGNPGYVSTYSFPRGHTDDGANIPKVDTIFVDFDIPADSEYRSGESRTLDGWKRSMSDLLIRVQMVADSLIESGKAMHWRASLSGHKGVHLFFDFHPIDIGYGGYTQFKRGLGEYGTEMIDRLDEISGGINIDPWVDVDSSDLSRMVRHPNTPHPGAKHRDESWCVPVTIEELSEMSPDDYLELTGGPREIPDEVERIPSPTATAEIGNKISNAGGSSTSSHTGSPDKDSSMIEAYKDESNDDITVSKIPLLVTDKPCIMAFVERDDGFAYGQESRTMEINIMKELVKHEVPIDVIVRFFRAVDGWNEKDSRDLVTDIISRYDGPFVCQNVWDAGGEFCVAMNSDPDEECGIYTRNKAT